MSLIIGLFCGNVKNPDEGYPVATAESYWIYDISAKEPYN